MADDEISMVVKVMGGVGLWQGCFYMCIGPMAREFGLEVSDMTHFLYGMTDVLDGRSFEFTDSYRDTLRAQMVGSVVSIVFTEWGRIDVSMSVPGYIYAEFVYRIWMTHSSTIGRYVVKSSRSPPLVKI